MGHLLFAREPLARILQALASGDRAVSLVGPRQVGKTVLLKQAIDVLRGLRPDHHGTRWNEVPPQNITYFSFDDERLLGRPISPRDVVELRPPGMDPSKPRFFLFDEISRAANWDSWLKNAVDQTRHGPERQDHRFAVCDSSRQAIVQGRIESGLGRWDEIGIEPWTFREVLSAFRPEQTPEDTVRLMPMLLARYLTRGGFPAHCLSDEDDEVAHRRLRQDVGNTAIYRDLAATRIDTEAAHRLFVYLAQRSGSVHNLRRRSEDLGQDARSIGKWLELLQAAGLVRVLDRLERSVKASARLRNTPRVFVADHGLVAAYSVRPGDARERVPEILETVVFLHLRHLQSAHGARLSYYRVDGSTGTVAGECDFVLDDGREPVLIEVTTSDPDRHGKAARLRRIATDLSARRCFLVHPGLDDREADGVRRLPLFRFLLRPEVVLEEGGGVP